MKKIILSLIFIGSVVVSPISAQVLKRNVKGDHNVVKVTHQLPAFDKINASGIDHIILTQTKDGENSVIVETDENLQQFIKPEVRNQTLYFSYRNINPSSLKFYVTVSGPIDAIQSSGASFVKNTTPLNSRLITLKSSGAANTKLMIESSKTVVENSGAAHTILMGNCTTLSADLSGAASLNAVAIRVDSLFFRGSGAASAKARVVKYVRKELSGTAHLNLVSLPGKDLDINTRHKVVKVITYQKELQDKQQALEAKKEALEQEMSALQMKMNRMQQTVNDSTRVDIGALKVVVVDGDSTKIKVGNHMLVVDDRGNVRWRKRNKARKFRGHWAGVDLGVNGYVNPQFNANFGAVNDYLSLRFEKSLNINLNLIEQNIPFNKEKTAGLVTGLGLVFNDYHFSHPTYLSDGGNQLQGYYINGASVRKTKLSAMYLSVPLLLEFQAKTDQRRHRFFINFGVIGNVKLHSHTKIYFNDPNDSYILQDPSTGGLLTTIYTTPDRNNRNIVKNTSGYYLNPFRVDATVRIGFPLLSLYATYGLTPMFQSGKGPELHQWSLGLCLVNW
ncbi:MAG: DUF2807 domain-containing protein [Bacteroidales bacterium]|nr:DUF2807 domain-containing protein [Bacteroidales bacterium]